MSCCEEIFTTGWVAHKVMFFFSYVVAVWSSLLCKVLIFGLTFLGLFGSACFRICFNLMWLRVWAC
jgi:hypothetical protein